MERNMTTAQNIKDLADGGYVTQAIRDCETQSVSIVDDGDANEYLFPDGSCVRVENRIITIIEALSA